MDNTLLLTVAIGVFTLMVIGLVLTVREFRNNIIVEQPEASEADRTSRSSQTKHSPVGRTA